MNEHNENHKTDLSHENQDEDLKHFDMYHFFSRKDVLAAIAVVVVLLLYILAKTLFAPQAV